MRDEDTRDPVRDFVSVFSESSVKPRCDRYDDAATAGFSSCVLAVDDALGDEIDDIPALNPRSIMLRALPVSSIARLICGAILAAALPALILSAAATGTR